MPGTVRVWTAAAVITLARLAVASDACAGSPAPRRLGPVQTLTIDTGRNTAGKVILAGRDAALQLVVTGTWSSSRQRDLTRSVKYTTIPSGIVAVDAAGMVTPRKEGTTTIRASEGALGTEIAVSVTHLVEDLPVHFANQVVPVFTKYGCNAGGCHGKAGGQNGFALSLLGFEPQDDFDTLVREPRSRRLFLAAPAESLLLRKATGAAAHGGGKRIELESPAYRVLHRWIEQGAPAGQPGAPVVQGIEVFPRERLLDREADQQLAVTAHLSDGSTMDVTRMTQFESNYTELAQVSSSGLVSTKPLAGTVAVMARYQSHVAVFRGMVPLGAPIAELPTARTFVDALVFAQLKRLGLPPSPACDDATFIRRATLDIAGRLPRVEDVEQFIADKGAAKDEQLIDRLLASPDHADYFANKWSAILRNRRKAPNDDVKPTTAFHAWIRQSILENKPYDRFCREVLTAAGEEVKEPPVVWYREVKEMSAQVEDVAQLFLGQRLACARCHHHPFEKWSQQDYYRFAAFFARLEVKEPPPPKGKPKKGEPPPVPEPLRVGHKPGMAEAVNPRTSKPVRPAGLGGEEIAVAASEDPRARLVDWMTQPDNPFFAKALVNRYWKHFLGRGLVEPEDDMRATNPPSNPELLEALAKHLVQHKYDVKDLIRTICTSQVYRLSALPNAHNADDRQNYSRFLPKRLHAEVLLDSIDDVTLARTSFKGVPAGTRAVQLPDNQFDSYFLSVFGRPDSASACECERGSDASLAQCLHMFNSQEVLGKVAGPRAQQLARDKRPPEQRLRELYLTALAREPSPEEAAALLAHLEKKGGSQAAYEDVIWALINTKEFLFNH